MSGTTVITLDTEVRKLRPAELYTLTEILSISESWKRLMSLVPEEDADDVPRFTSEHFKMIEHAEQQQKRSAAEIFLEEWSTIGKQRPTLKLLLDLLVKAELFRAADYLAGDILKQELPKRPENGPAAAIDMSDVMVNLLNEQRISDEESTNTVLPGNEPTLPATSMPMPYIYKVEEIPSQELPAFDQI